MLHPALGRWAQRDPEVYIDGIALSQYVAGSPATRLDLTGLWGEAVHFDKTREWAIDVGMKEHIALLVAFACNSVDPSLVAWPFRTTRANLEWHFDIPVSRPNVWGEGDSRWEHSRVELTNAKYQCLEPRHDVVAAAASLGKSLHPLQDWVAHGVWDPTYHWYNITNWRPHPDGTDDFSKDDKRSPDGRLQDDLTSARNQKQYLVSGSKRAALTEAMVEKQLLEFKNFLSKDGVCWCVMFGADY